MLDTLYYYKMLLSTVLYTCVVVGELEQIFLYFVDVLYDLDPAALGCDEGGRGGQGYVGQVLVLPDAVHGRLLLREEVGSKLPQLQQY